MDSETSEKLDSNEKILYLKKLKMVGHTDQKFTVPEMKSPTFSTMPFYLPLWDNDSFSKTYSRTLPTVDGDLNLGTLSNIKKKKVIAGRVHRKSKLIYFSKENCEYPFRFEILLSDGSKTASVTFWNELALFYYYDVMIGDVLIIQNPEVRSVSRYNIFRGSCDVSCNNNKSIIQKYTDAPPEYAPLVFEITGLDKLEKCLPDDLVTVFGVILNVSMVERTCERSLDTHSDEKKQFFHFRWIKILDPHYQTPVDVKLYSNSQFDQLKSLKAGKMLLMSDLNVRKINDEVFCITTFGSLLVYEDTLSDLIDRMPEGCPLEIVATEIDNWRMKNYKSIRGYMANQLQVMVPPIGELEVTKSALRAETILTPALTDILANFTCNESKLLIFKARLMEIHVGEIGDSPIKKINRRSNGYLTSPTAKKLKTEARKEDSLTLIFQYLNDKESFLTMTYPIWTFYSLETQLGVLFGWNPREQDPDLGCQEACGHIYMILGHFHAPPEDTAQKQKSILGLWPMDTNHEEK